MYKRLVKYEPAKEAGDFSNQPAFFQICRLKAGSRLPWKALSTMLPWSLSSLGVTGNQYVVFRNC